MNFNDLDQYIEIDSLSETDADSCEGLLTDKECSDALRVI